MPGNPLLNGAISREGGFMVLLLAGENLTKGNLVRPAATTLQVVRSAASSYDPIGVVYSNAAGASAVLSGEWCWVVVSGLAQVLLDAAGTIGGLLITSATLGMATPIAAPPPPPTGHLLETTGAAGLAWAVLHWN